MHDCTFLSHVISYHTKKQQQQKLTVVFRRSIFENISRAYSIHLTFISFHSLHLTVCEMRVQIKKKIKSINAIVYSTIQFTNGLNL